MKPVVLTKPFPSLAIVEGSIKILPNPDITKTANRLTIKVKPIGDCASTEELVTMLEEMIEEKTHDLFPAIASKRPENAFVVDIRDIVMRLTKAMLAEDGTIELECVYLMNYTSLVKSGTLDNGLGIIRPVIQTFGETRYCVISFYLHLSPSGDNIVYRNTIRN